MKIGASFGVEKLQLYHLVAAKRIGFDFVEFYIDDLIADITDFELQFQAIRDIMDSYDLTTIIHLPHMNTQLISDIDLWTNYVSLMSEQIQIIGNLGITNTLVFHGVFGGIEHPEGVTLEAAEDYKEKAIVEWLTISKENNMKLLLENTDECAKHLKPVFKKFKDLGFTFDIGHANLLLHNCSEKTSEEKIDNLLHSFPKKLAHIHIHDNFGGTKEIDDKHMPICTGNINFVKFFTELKKMKYNKTITLEIYNSLYQIPYLETSFKVVKEILEDL
ncbi:MAG: sugar phosphate isomerase/epimerase family protein [Candidatus Heimdallarchaeota archaeon]